MSSLLLALVAFELFVMVLSISLHDCAQAWAANRLGDPTARLLGRMTLNPARHFDPFGMALWPLLYIFRSPLILGWGKRVPMTARNFRRPSRDETLATMAGPAAQLLTALLAMLTLIVVRHVYPASTISLALAAQVSMRMVDGLPAGLPSLFPLVLFLYFCILVNLLLFVFNLIPLPYLDGGKVLLNYLPYNAAQTYQRMGLYLMFAFMFLGFGIILAIFLPLLDVFNRLLFSL